MRVPSLLGQLLLGLVFRCASAEFQYPFDRDHVGASSCDVACAELAAQFKTALHYPNSDNYTFWDSKQGEVRNACRVEPSTSQDVSTILKILTTNWCKFAVKSGGHSRSKGASKSDGGVTVDMKRISSVTLSDDKSQAKIGTGSTWDPVYSTLEKDDLAVIGGRVGDVGVGGLMLGGGINFLSPKYGWAADNVLEFELVLPNATVVAVNENSHPDLYFALRGGGNNFGIVTYFTCKTFPQGKMLGGQKFYTEDKLDAVLEQGYELTTTHSDDTNIAFWTGLGYLQEQDMVLALIQQMYLEPIVKPAVYSELDKIEPIGSTVGIRSMSNVTIEIQATSPPGGRNVYGTITFSPSFELEKRMCDIWKEEIESLKSVEGFLPAMTFQPIFKKAIEEMKVRGGNAFGLESEGPLTLMNLATSWKQASDDDAMFAMTRTMLDRFTESAIELGVYNKYKYMNYADNMVQPDVFSGYSDENVERLRQIQKMVDPEGIFTTEGLNTGYYKLN